MEGLIVLLVIIGFLLWGMGVYKSNKKAEYTGFDSQEDAHEDLANFTIDFKVKSENINQDKNEYKWYSKGEKIIVSNYNLTDQFVYVGINLHSGYSAEPSLINPSLQIDKSRPDFKGNDLSYWPSYSECSPQARAAYLHYCSNSFETQDIPIGYVFMYYYGIERRLLVDEIEKKEEKELIAEVRRLRKLHSDNSSFNGYSNRLLNFIEVDDLVHENIDHSRLKSYSELSDNIWELNLSETDVVQLGYYFILEEDFPSNLLFKVGLNNSFLRTPGKRCIKELIQLFRIRLPEEFRKVNSWENSGQVITQSYSPASSAIRGGYEKSINTPDLIRSNQGLINKLSNLIEECQSDLESYSRLLANDHDKNSLQALVRLPPELINPDDYPKVSELFTFIDSRLKKSDYILIESSQLTHIWDIEGVNKFRKKYAIEVAQVFQHLGYGIEPDIRFGYHKIDKEGKIAVFRIDKEKSPKRPTKEYKLVLPIIHMTALVGLADGIFKPEEEKHFEEYIESLMQLNDDEKKRVNGYLFWLKSARVNVARLKGKIKNLDSSRKTRIIEYLISLAWADKHIHPDEVSMLQKLCNIFDLDEYQVLRKLYDLQHGKEDELVQVTTKSDSKGHEVPREKQSSNLLNEEILQARIDQTNEVQDILSDVFEEEDDEDSRNIEPGNAEDDFTSYLGLDKQHSQLVDKLIPKEVWTQEEFQNLCNDIGLMPNGAIEIINEKSFDKYEDDLLIMHDELEINKYISDKL